jgi:hypothetical protein
MNAQLNIQHICDAILSAFHRFRVSLRSARRRNVARSREKSTHRPPRHRNPESGYAFLFALGLILLMIAGSVVVMQKGATIRRRQMEQETIWRGNQYARAIRLYYHKTGHYPQTLDDLQKGMPDLHFLRQAFKNPTNPSDGAWRFIYVNAAGQIIGSTRYANLQQMALMDANGGQLPTLQGQPGQLGQSVASLSDSNSGQQANTAAAIAALGNPNGIPNSPTTSSSSTSGSDTSGNPPPDGQNPQSPSNPNSSNQFGPNQSGAQNPQTAPTTAGGLNGLNNLGNGQNMAGLAPGGLSVDPATLAAMALLKPTGPVDGPVLGGFLTGVGCTQDARSLKFYHGGKKYVDWEFIWNPLEDAASAMQQQMGGATGGANGLPGGTMGLPIANPFGGGPTANPNGNNGANPGGNSGGNMPPLQNPPNPQSNQFQQQPQ